VSYFNTNPPYLIICWIKREKIQNNPKIGRRKDNYFVGCYCFLVEKHTLLVPMARVLLVAVVMALLNIGKSTLDSP